MTATVYHRGKDGWERTVVEDAWAVWRKGASHSAGFSRADRAGSLILIPWRDNLEIAVEDGIFPGVGPEAANGALKDLDGRMQIVTEVARYCCGSALDHWEVTAR